MCDMNFVHRGLLFDPPKVEKTRGDEKFCLKTLENGAFFIWEGGYFSLEFLRDQK